MTNMEKVAEILGVKLGEKFNIPERFCNPYSLDKSQGMLDKDGYLSGDILVELLCGNLTIEKIKPELKITIVTQVCGYCGDETIVGFPQIIKHCEVHTICEDCLEGKYSIRL